MIETVMEPLPYDGGEKVKVKPWYPTRVSTQRKTTTLAWTKGDAYEDATLMQLDGGGRPGTGYMLRVPLDVDPETGGYWDCDGDRAMRCTMMYGADAHIHKGGVVIVEGFVSDDPDDYGTSYHIEQWMMSPRSEDDDD